MVNGALARADAALRRSLATCGGGVTRLRSYCKPTSEQGRLKSEQGRLTSERNLSTPAQIWLDTLIIEESIVGAKEMRSIPTKLADVDTMFSSVAAKYKAEVFECKRLITKMY